MTKNVVGENIIYLDVVDSTNTYAKKIALKEEEGTVVIANHQTNGRGRLKRIWQSPSEKGLWMSIILKPKMSIEIAYLFNLLAAVSVCEAINETISHEVQIKWPNDILYKGKKLCGILTEMKVIEESKFILILGIGINVNIKQDDMPEIIKNKATSLYEIEKKELDKELLLYKILKKINLYYNFVLKENNFQEIISFWKKLNCTLGKQVKVNVNVKEEIQIIDGYAQDITSRGALLLKLNNGKMREITFGDIYHCN